MLPRQPNSEALRDNQNQGQQNKKLGSVQLNFFPNGNAFYTNTKVYGSWENLNHYPKFQYWS
jgi:hypothetical protein